MQWKSCLSLHYTVYVRAVCVVGVVACCSMWDWAPHHTTATHVSIGTTTNHDHSHLVWRGVTAHSHSQPIHRQSTVDSAIAHPNPNPNDAASLRKVVFCRVSHTLISLELSPSLLFRVDESPSRLDPQALSSWEPSRVPVVEQSRAEQRTRREKMSCQPPFACLSGLSYPIPSHPGLSWRGSRPSYYLTLVVVHPHRVIFSPSPRPPVSCRSHRDKTHGTSETPSFVFLVQSEWKPGLGLVSSLRIGLSICVTVCPLGYSTTGNTN